MCSNSPCQRRQQLEVQEMEENLEQESAVSSNVGATVRTHHSWIPTFGIQLFRPHVVALNVVRPFQMPRAVANPYNGLAMTTLPANRRERVTVYRHL